MRKYYLTVAAFFLCTVGSAESFSHFNGLPWTVHAYYLEIHVMNFAENVEYGPLDVESTNAITRTDVTNYIEHLWGGWGNLCSQSPPDGFNMSMNENGDPMLVAG